MDSIDQVSSESSENPESSLASSSTTISSPAKSDLTIIVTPEPQRKPKTYGSLTTDKLSNVKSFIKKTIKDEKADRLERKELDKVAIAKMRLAADGYDEMLDNMQKERDFSNPRSEDMRAGEGDGNGDECGADENVQEVSSEELHIISLRRQLANMRKRS